VLEANLGESLKWLRSRVFLARCVLCHPCSLCGGHCAPDNKCTLARLTSAQLVTKSVGQFVDLAITARKRCDLDVGVAQFHRQHLRQRNHRRSGLGCPNRCGSFPLDSIPRRFILPVSQLLMVQILRRDEREPVLRQRPGGAVDRAVLVQA
jgi:hypothetical protein